LKDFLTAVNHQLVHGLLKDFFVAEPALIRTLWSFQINALSKALPATTLTRVPLFIKFGFKIPVCLSKEASF
jgi:hypothetical protein